MRTCIVSSKVQGFFVSLINDKLATLESLGHTIKDVLFCPSDGLFHALIIYTESK